MLRVDNGSGVDALEQHVCRATRPGGAFHWSTVGSSQIQGVAFRRRSPPRTPMGTRQRIFRAGPRGELDGDCRRGHVADYPGRAFFGPLLSAVPRHYTVGYSFTPTGNFEVTAVAISWRPRFRSGPLAEFCWPARRTAMRRIVDGNGLGRADPAPGGQHLCCRVLNPAGQNLLLWTDLISGSPWGPSTRVTRPLEMLFPRRPTTYARWQFVDLSGNLAAATPLLTSPMSAPLSQWSLDGRRHPCGRPPAMFISRPAAVADSPAQQHVQRPRRDGPGSHRERSILILRKRTMS